LLGHPDVELGALAGITPEIIPLVVRRVALNISQIIRGVNTVDLPAALSVDSKLLINGQTAAVIGYSPALDMLVYANFLHAGALRPESKGLSFTQAMKDAEKGNTSLTISDAGVEISRREKQLSRSVLLPQVGSYISYQKSDDRGGASSLLVPEDLTVAGIRASQMIYDDFAISNFRSSSRLYDGELQAREADRLDVLADAGQNYLLYALAIILNRIEAANVHLTEDNLEISKLRLDVGYSGRDEVYRWQAELAQRRSGLFDSYAEIEASRIALNQVLGIEQSLRWEPEEVSPDAASTYFLGGRLNELWNNVARLRKLHDFAVEFAYENSPELKFLEQAISAQGIQVGQRNRRFVLPSFSANFSYDFQLNRSPSLPDIEDAYWTFDVGASYPIFTGGGRIYDKGRENAVLQGLERERQLVNERVEQRTRTAVRRLESSYHSIRFSQVAAENAGLNLDVVQDKYAQGILNITDQLEAQTQSFTADQNEAAAVYAYLLDLLELQRALSWFQHEKTDAEKNEFANRVIAAVSAE
jgi:outer membrane protein TolC